MMSGIPKKAVADWNQMRKIMLGMGLALLLPVQAFGQSGMPGGMDGGMGSGGMGGGMGRGGGRNGGDESPPEGGRGNRPPVVKPISRERLDKLVEAMFQSADVDRDGIVTVDELRAVLAAKRDATIRARFEKIDTNHNKLIEPQEFIAWQTGLGSAATSERESLGADGGPIPESLPPPLTGKQDDMIVRRLIEPLSATVIVSANTNYDKGASLPELLAYERQKFDAADTNKDGFLTEEELHAAEPRGPGGRGPRGQRGPDMPPPPGAPSD
jgi:Ca2+-binding EF-hand superfamily protein